MKNKNKFIYLFVNEISRSFKIIVAMLSVFFAGHIGLVLKQIYSQKRYIKEYIADGQTIATYIAEHGEITFTNTLNQITQLLIMWMFFGILVILVYSIIIWTREWYGSNKTIYTLMTIPVSRHSIILSKFLTVLLIGTTYISTQLAALFIDNILMKAIFGSTVFKAAPVFKSFFNSSMCNFFPKGLIIFIFLLLILIVVVMLIFNTIMLQRSYKLKGLILGALMIICTGFLYIAMPGYLKLFVMETIIYEIGLSLVLIVLNYLCIYYLLNNKVHV